MAPSEEKYFGKVIFPDQNKTIESIWLTVIESKIYVELPDPELNVTEWGVVWGIFNKLGNVTLIECGLSSQIHGIGGNVRKLAVHKLVQGIHLENNKQVFIDSLQFECETLNEWVYNNETFETDIANVTIDSFPQPKSILEYQSKKFNIDIKIAYAPSYSFLSYNIRRAFIVDVSFSSKINIYELYSFKRKFEQFILFITNENPGFEIVGYNKLGKKILGIHKILNANRFMHSINIDYNKIKNRLAGVLEIWFEEIELEPIYELLLERKNNPDLSIARHFLNLSVGIESFHSKFIDTKKRSLDHPAILNRNRIKELLKCDSELLQYFKSESSYWSKQDYIDRLKNLKPWFEYVTKDIFPFSTEDLLEKIKGTRNKLAHEGKYLVHFSEFEVFLTAYTLELVLRLLIIQKLGLDEIIGTLKSEAKQNIKDYAEWNNYNQKTIRNEIQ